MLANSLISIVIPTYNRAHLIKETLDSIAAQIYTNWECFIVDDGSTDGTSSLLAEYIKKDKRFKYLINNRTKGAQGARNTGLLCAEGSYIQFFDSDNIMYPHHLQMKMDAFQQNSDLDIITSFSHVKNANHEIIDIFTWVTLGPIFEKLIRQHTYVDTNSALFKKEILKAYLLDEKVPSFQELDLHLELSRKANYGMVWEFLTAYYRRDVDTISSDKIKEKKGEVYNLLKFKTDYIEIIGDSRFNNRIDTCISFNEDILNYALEVFPGIEKMIRAIMKSQNKLKLINKIKNRIYRAF
jgi:glycosyltransferase involved in cell wall biosynthesis